MRMVVNRQQETAFRGSETEWSLLMGRKDLLHHNITHVHTRPFYAGNALPAGLRELGA